MADSATLLCFDEMQITDITDAMLVGRLFERLFERGVVVVTTSNRAPDELYKDGLNRQLFLPFIALIKERLEVHELASATDHRLDRLQRARRSTTRRSGRRRPPRSTPPGSSWRAGRAQPLTLTVQGRAVTLPAFRNGVARASLRRALRPAARAGRLSRDRRGGRGADPRRHPGAVAARATTRPSASSR